MSTFVAAYHGTCGGCGDPIAPGDEVAVAHLVEVHPAQEPPHFMTCGGLDDDYHAVYCSPWAQPGAWHLVLRDVQPLGRPVPARGRLGLWTLPEDVEAAVREQVSL